MTLGQSCLSFWTGRRRSRLLTFDHNNYQWISTAYDRFMLPLPRRRVLVKLLGPPLPEHGSDGICSSRNVMLDSLVHLSVPPKPTTSLVAAVLLQNGWLHFLFRNRWGKDCWSSLHPANAIKKLVILKPCMYCITIYRYMYACIYITMDTNSPEVLHVLQNQMNFKLLVALEQTKHVDVQTNLICNQLIR